MTTGLIVRTDGTAAYVELPPMSEQFEFLRRTVGGWIECVFVTGGVHLYCNEEGKLDGLPYNEKATFLAGRQGIDPLVGDVIFLGDGPEGEEGDLPPEWRHLPWVYQRPDPTPTA